MKLIEVLSKNERHIVLKSLFNSMINNIDSRETTTQIVCEKGLNHKKYSFFVPNDKKYSKRFLKCTQVKFSFVKNNCQSRNTIIPPATFGQIFKTDDVTFSLKSKFY